jgi:hypothetical protein
MTDVYVTNVVKRVTVTPGATSGGGGTGGTNYLPLNNTWTGANNWTPSSAGAIPLTVKGALGQSVALTEWRDNSNNILAAVDNVGQISTATNIYVGRGVSAGGGNKVIVMSNATPPAGNIIGGGVLYADSGYLRYRDSSGGVHMPISTSGTKGNILVHNGASWVSLSVGTNGQVLSSNSAQPTGLEWITGGSGGGHIIASAGTPYAQRATLNFIGATVADDAGNNRTNVTITSGASYQTIKSAGSAVTARPTLNFVNNTANGVTIADNAGSTQTDVTIAVDAAAGTPSLRSLGSGATQAAAGTHAHDYSSTYEAYGAVATHAAAADPHTGYLTQTEADAIYAAANRGIPSGGTQGYVLAKTLGTDYVVGWVQNSATVATPLSLISTADSVPLTVKAFTGQTANWFQVQGGGGTNWFIVDSIGQTAIGNAAANIDAAMLKVRPMSASGKGIIVRAYNTTPTVNLIEAQSSAGAELFSVGPDGTVTAPNIGPKLWVVGANDGTPGGAEIGDVILRRAT